MSHPGIELRENLKSISHRCHLFEVAFVWELTKETINLPLSCLQGGEVTRDEGDEVEGRARGSPVDAARRHLLQAATR